MKNVIDITIRSVKKSKTTINGSRRRMIIPNGIPTIVIDRRIATTTIRMINCGSAVNQKAKKPMGKAKLLLLPIHAELSA
jgi:hypothetical protein